MVRELNCCCSTLGDLYINSSNDFLNLKCLFDDECKNGRYKEMIPQQPYYTWTHECRTVKWYATKWYVCTICGCLWEFQYPDFPARGFIRKFPDGKYKERGY